jgi:hypothetical protein
MTLSARGLDACGHPGPQDPGRVSSRPLAIGEPCHACPSGVAAGPSGHKR